MKEWAYPVISFVLTLVLTPAFIKYMKKRQLGQTTREEGPSWHEEKTGTPTMGGTVFILMSLVSQLLLLVNSQWDMNVLLIFIGLLLFGLIGFLDDFISIFRQQNEGLTAKQKFLAQFLSSLLVVILAQRSGVLMFSSDNSVWLVVIMVFSVVWITGFSNAVNLTDGLDGLATGLNIIAYSTYSYVAYKDGNTMVMLACLIVVGALLGFVSYNVKPAKIFMGDVGSLALGAGLAIVSILLNRPFSLLWIGLVFVVETASVILQVLSYKTTGKRLFKMSPIHHHFEMIGWSEMKVVLVFWSTGLIAALTYIFFMV